MIPNKTEVLNLKTRKTQVLMVYLSLKKKKHIFPLQDGALNHFSTNFSFGSSIFASHTFLRKAYSFPQI
jgi:hypothetical protein